MENITENQGKCKFLQRTCAICNLHSCYIFVLMLHEIAFVFSQSEAHNFFMYSRVKKLFLKSKFMMLVKLGYHDNVDIHCENVDGILTVC